MSMVHLNMINMVDVGNGIHSLEPGLFFAGVPGKGLRKLSRLSRFEAEGKNYKTFCTL